MARRSVKPDSQRKLPLLEVEEEEDSDSSSSRRKKREERDYIPRITGTLRQAVLIHMRENGFGTFSAALLDLVRRGLESTSLTRLNTIGFYAQLEGATFRQMWLARARGDYEPPDIDKLTDEQFKVLYALLGENPKDNPQYGDDRLL